VEDLVLIMNVIAGKDEKDDTSLQSPHHFPLQINPDSKVKSIAIVRELMEGSDPEVSKTIYKVAEKFQELGVEISEVSLKNVSYALPSYYTLATAEASSNLARYDNLRYGFSFPSEGYEWNSYITKVRTHFGEEVKRRILIGSYVLSSGYYSKYYLKARQLRYLLKKELLSNLKKFDLLAAPTMPIVPFKIGEKIQDPLKMYLMDVDTVIANLAGVPAISIPAGFSKDLPIGLQLMAGPFGEQKLVDGALMLNNASNISTRPSI